MHVFFLILVLFVCAHGTPAPGPKAAGTILPGSVPVIEVRDGSQSALKPLPALTAENTAGHLRTDDGSAVLLLRFSSPGAAALRLHLANVHLPEGAAIYTYTLGGDANIVSSSGPFTGSGDFWTTPLRGDSAYLEVVWGDEIPGDIPFEVPELEVVDELQPADPVSVTGDIRKGVFRGTEVTFEVVDDLAIFEGDMILGPAVDMPESSGKTDDKAGLAISGTRYRWPNGIIPYSISSSLPNQARVTQAIAHWNQQLAGVIRFVQRTNQQNYIWITPGSRCSSSVGMIGYGAQVLYLSSGCTTGNVIHELGHSAGLWHEQSRADRNQHIRVLYANMQAGVSLNFSQNISNGDDVGGYDFGSIMHYGNYAFSANGKPTIETIPAGIPIGQRDALSTGDIRSIRSMYGSSGSAGVAADPIVSNPPAPAAFNVTLSTNPAGQTIKVDGSSRTAPVVVSWTAGSSHTIEAVESSGSAALNFVKWSDGGARVHSVTANAGHTAIKADYSAQFSFRVGVANPGTGTVSVNPAPVNQMMSSNSVVDLSANPAAGYCFASWAGLLSGTPAQTRVTVTGPLDIQATFRPGAVTLNSTFDVVKPSGEIVSVGVSTSSSCSWKATSHASWVTISGASSRTGSTVLNLNVSANTSKATRIGYVEIGTSWFLISQPGS